MALGFQHNNPASFDHSRVILQDRSGENIAAGIEQLGQNISQGIQQFRKDKAEKERTKAVIDYATSMGLVGDEAEGKAAVKAAGGSENAMQFLVGMKGLEERKAARAKQEAAAAQALQDMQLLAASVPAGANPVLDKYRAQGGRISPEVLKMADALNQQPDAGLGQVMDIRGVPYVRTQKGNLSPLPQQKKEGEDFKTVTIGDRKMVVGPGNKYFDEQGNPVSFGNEQPMSATDWIISGQDPAGYAAYREKFARATTQQPAAQGAAPAAAAPAGQQKQFVIGTKVKQGGKTYQWSGQEWREVK